MQTKAWPRILPFALFMAVIGLEEGLRFLDSREWISLSEMTFHLLYPLKPLAALVALLLLRKAYTELHWADLRRPGQTLLSIGVGLLVFVLWINMDWTFGALTEPPGFNPQVFADDTLRLVMILIRVFSAVVVVSIMEELFWRSFLLRYIINPRFAAVALGTFTLPSFLICAVLFGLAHHFILAGIMAGMAYALLLYRTKSLAQCILAHAVTNLALAIYVLQTGQWYFW
ncbi:CAAX prenyl protease-related protein [Desulfonatronum thioautotrophicum]|uniref:CAAX prenyl protease-related protein n=1 Tax=Desulfonatronum thioautotrophicum TaxID=617001 RepID=UPI0005EAE86D|nr:CAAX prenyl protease-related protein [Desulfonatronum thioautotrophicum]